MSLLYNFGSYFNCVSSYFLALHPSCSLAKVYLTQTNPITVLIKHLLINHHTSFYIMLSYSVLSHITFSFGSILVTPHIIPLYLDNLFSNSQFNWNVTFTHFGPILCIHHPDLGTLWTPLLTHSVNALLVALTMWFGETLQNCFLPLVSVFHEV